MFYGYICIINESKAKKVGLVKKFIDEYNEKKAIICLRDVQHHRKLRSLECITFYWTFEKAVMMQISLQLEGLLFEPLLNSGIVRDILHDSEKNSVSKL